VPQKQKIKKIGQTAISNMLHQSGVFFFGAALFALSMVFNSLPVTSIVSNPQMHLREPVLLGQQYNLPSDKFIHPVEPEVPQFSLQRQRELCIAESQCQSLIDTHSLAASKKGLCSSFAETLFTTCKESQVYSLSEERCVLLGGHYNSTASFVLDFLNQSVVQQGKQPCPSISASALDSKQVLAAVIVVIMLVFVQL